MNLIAKIIGKYFNNIQVKRDDKTLHLLGKIKSDLNTLKKVTNIEDVEFSVYSQWGDDGIIQHLIKNVDIENKIFIEFGVENYLEANTRYLLVNDNWSGLIIDGSDKHIKNIQSQDIYWKYDLTAVCSFITRDNINTIISDNGIKGDIGILHIDIDGNDYWIWQCINTVSPDIVIMEYNSVFGIERAITIPYSADFVRTAVHSSNLYAGCSLLALCDLAEEKGYFFVGSNSNGNNAYFVKKEKIGMLKPLRPEEGYIESKFREGRDANGQLIYVAGKNRINVINGMPVFNTRANKIEEI